MKAADGCRLNRNELEALQIEQLKLLVSAVLGTNAFYSAKFAKAGVTASFASLAEYCSAIPFSDKRELVEDQTQHPPYGSNLTYPLARYTRFHQTSGTTAKPVRWLDTPESWDWMVDCWTCVYQSAGTGPEDRVFFPFSFGPFLGFWVAYDAAQRMGALAIAGGGMRTIARLHTILDNEVTVLCSTPSYAVRLAEVAAQEKIDLNSAKVRKLIVAGEAGGSIPGTRALIERLWPGASVVDHHGMTEIGPASYACPKRPGVLHIMEAAYFPEVIDPHRQQPAAPGESGELILTNLGRLGSPLLRYRTGDIVRRAAEIRCACGSFELALEGGIVGRIDDMVNVRGVNVYPSAVEEILRSCGVVEFRVETYTERALEEMNVQIEAAPGSEDRARLRDRVAAALQNALGFRAVVSCVDELPRFEGKAKRWVHR